MAKRTSRAAVEETFGQRLARLRKAAGMSQRDLAAEARISQRMVAYYEAQAPRSPTHLLPVLADVLGVTTDALLGRTRAEPLKKVRDNRLWRRFQQIEKLSPADRRQVIRFIDTLVERDALRRRVAPAEHGAERQEHVG